MKPPKGNFTRHWYKTCLAVPYRIRQAVVYARKIGLFGIYFYLMCQQVKIPCRKTGIGEKLCTDPKEINQECNTTVEVWTFTIENDFT